MQAPFVTKDWEILPISIIAVGFLVYIGVWAALKLGIVRKNGAAGDKSPEYWENYYRAMEDRIVARLTVVIRERRKR